MARYYFHVEDVSIIGDSVGTELPSLEAAFDHAKAVGAAHRDRRANGTPNWNIIVTDEAGNFVALVPCHSD